MDIRPAKAGDEAAILELNREAEWATSPLDLGALEALMGLAEHTLVADLDGTVGGFALALSPRQPYASTFYRWFDARYDNFLYLDRIVVSPPARRRHVGSALYDAMEDLARPAGRMLCEVNLVPPNHASLAFHARRGYKEIGTLEVEGGKTVVLLEKPLS